MTTPIVFFFLIITLSEQNIVSFGLNQTITQSTSRIWDIAYSADEQYLVTGGEQENVYVFNKNADNSFELFQTINSGSEDTKSVDISSDHEWIIICKTTKVFVYNFNSDDNKFKKYQTLSDSHKNEAVDMTDDHVYLIIGKINGLVLVYRFVNTSSQYELDHVLSEPTEVIQNLQITNNYEYLVIGTFGKVYVYVFNGIGFVLLKTLFQDHIADYRWISIDDDNDQLVVAQENSKNVMIFQKNGAQFYERQNFLNETIRSVKLTTDGKYLVVGILGGVKVYKNQNSRFSLAQTLILDQQMINTVFIVGDYLFFGGQSTNLYVCCQQCKAPISGISVVWWGIPFFTLIGCLVLMVPVFLIVLCRQKRDNIQNKDDSDRVRSSKEIYQKEDSRENSEVKNNKTSTALKNLSQDWDILMDSPMRN